MNDTHLQSAIKQCELLLIQGIQKVPEDDNNMSILNMVLCHIHDDHLLQVVLPLYDKCSICESKGGLDLSLIFYKGIQYYTAHHVAIARQMHQALPTYDNE